MSTQDGGTVTIGWMDPGQTEGEFTHHLIALVLYDRRSNSRVGNVVRVTGAYIDSGRCSIVRDFLDGEDEWLFMLDADMLFDADSLDRLLAAADPVERPVMAGLYFSGGRQGGPLLPLVYRLGDDGHTRIVWDYPRDQVTPIDATGGGFILWHRSVLEAVGEAYASLPDGSKNPLPWFCDVQRDGIAYGEDIEGCLRARRLGFPIHMHTGVKAAHKKPGYLTEAFYDQVRAAHQEAG